MPLELTLLDSDTSPAGSLRSSVSWRSNTHIAVLGSTSPRDHIFPWDGSTIGADDSLAGDFNDAGVAFSPNKNRVAIGNATNKVIKVYAFSGGGLGTLLDTSAAWSGGTSMFGISWSPAGDSIVVSHSTSPFVSLFPWQGANFGVATQPGTPPSAAPGNADTTIRNAIAFSPDGKLIAVAENAATLLLVYPVAAGIFGTPFAPGAALNASTDGGKGVAWAEGSDFVALVVDDDPFVGIYPCNGTSLDSAITPTLVSAGAGFGAAAAFGKQTEALFVSGLDMDEGKRLYAYDFDGSTLTNRVDPDTEPGNGAYGLGLSIDNRALATFDADNDLDVYATGLTIATQSQGLPQIFLAS